MKKRGPDGWVSARYLSRASYDRWNDRNRWDDGRDRTLLYQHQRPQRPDRWPPLPAPVYPTYPRHNSSVCVNGPNGYFCNGN
ncbi:MAG: hypothetical protein MO846_09100 [Candidatus Devosia symbiotica]|nr:hypothetical protein [Candidatus Devosia symbiotica]